MDEQQIKSRMIALGFKKNTAQGLTPQEAAELERLRAELQKLKRG